MKSGPPTSTGIVVALAAEARMLTTSRVTRDRPVPLAGGAALVLCGMGPAAARRAATTLADAGAGALAAFGVAGALVETLRTAMLLCPDRILDDDGCDCVPDREWCERLAQRLDAAGLRVTQAGSLLSVAVPLLTAASKAQARSRHGAIAVDMESAAVATVARQRGLPFLALRAIVDEAADDVPAAVIAALDAWGRPRPLAFASALFTHPALLARLPRLSSHMRRATRALRTAAQAAGPTLAATA